MTKVYTFVDHDGSIYFDDRLNNVDQINKIIDESDKEDYLETLWFEISKHDNDQDITEYWNVYMKTVIEILEENNCEIVWK